MTFAEFIQQKSNSCPQIYLDNMLRDMLHLKKREIDEMGIYEYQSACNYAITTYITRGMLWGEGGKDFGKSVSGEKITFANMPINDLNPDFVSKLRKGEKP